jgi:tetratricopeptide (TPR) repeat protein
VQITLAEARQRIGDSVSRGDADGALELIAHLRQRVPRDYRLCMLSGRALLARGDVDAARAELERAAAAAPDEREIQVGLAACGVEEARSLAADLPPLPAADGERPPISAAALGHLYLRQFLLTHCTSQLEPIWHARRDRLDVGLVLAEAHWRLLEAQEAEAICRELLQAQPDCLKANLILAQMLAAGGQYEDAAHLVEGAQQLDPENDLAEELYEWLIVRDAALAPLRHREVLVEVAVPVAAARIEQAAARGQAAPAEERAAEAEAAAPAPIEEAVTNESRAEPEIEEAVAGEPPAEPEPVAQALETVLSQAPVEPPAHEPEPFWESAPQASAPESGQGEGPQPVAAPDVAETAPEPALAPVELDAEQVQLPVAWHEMDASGRLNQPRAVSGEAAAQRDRRVGAWNESCRRMGEQLRLGALRSSSIDAYRGALQLMYVGDTTLVAVGAAGAPRGRGRARLRQSLESSKEHIPT